MKKLITLLTLIFALVSPSALAADADPETSLWPAYDPETGLWGYITEDGAWGIAPQYTRAYHFHGGCAIVDMGEHPDALDTTQGVIDETGAFLLEPSNYVFAPCDFVWDPGDIFFVMDDEGRMGWFNIPNRFFSGLDWRECIAYEDSPYVLVDTHDADSGLAYRATGAYAVEPVYAMTEIYDTDVEDGFLAAMRADTGECELIEIGVGIVELPEGAVIDYYPNVGDGLIPFEDENGLYGYINTAGEIVIPAQFDMAEGFMDGYACVSLPEEVGLCRIIDRQGRTVLLLDEQEEWGQSPYRGVVDGALFIAWPYDSWSLYEPDGTLRCHYDLPEGADDVWLYEVDPGAPVRVEYSMGEDEYTYALLSRDGNSLTEPRWTWLSGNAQTLVAASEDAVVVWGEMVGTWGYVDAYGNTVLPAVYAWAEPFDGALARVTFDASTEGYINRSGEIVCQWPVQEEW